LAALWEAEQPIFDKKVVVLVTFFGVDRGKAAFE